MGAMLSGAGIDRGPKHGALQERAELKTAANRYERRLSRLRAEFESAGHTVSQNNRQFFVFLLEYYELSVEILRRLLSASEDLECVRDSSGQVRREILQGSARLAFVHQRLREIESLLPVGSIGLWNSIVDRNT